MAVDAGTPGRFLNYSTERTLSWLIKILLLCIFQSLKQILIAGASVPYSQA